MYQLTTFEQVFREVEARCGKWRLSGAETALQTWENFIYICEDGYDFIIEEYMNDISVRDTIADALNEPRLHELPEFPAFCERVGLIDERFKLLLKQDVTIPRPAGLPWWKAHPPRYAGPDLADDLKSRYGIVIEVVGG